MLWPMILCCGSLTNCWRVSCIEKSQFISSRSLHKAPWKKTLCVYQQNVLPPMENSSAAHRCPPIVRQSWPFIYSVYPRAALNSRYWEYVCKKVEMTGVTLEWRYIFTACALVQGPRVQSCCINYKQQGRRSGQFWKEKNLHGHRRQRRRRIPLVRMKTLPDGLKYTKIHRGSAEELFHVYSESRSG